MIPFIAVFAMCAAPDRAALVEEALRTDPRYANIAAAGSDTGASLFDINDEEDRARHERCWGLIDDILSHAPLRYRLASSSSPRWVCGPDCMSWDISLPVMRC